MNKFKPGDMVKFGFGQIGIVHEYKPKFLWVDAHYTIRTAKPITYQGKSYFAFEMWPDTKISENELEFYKNSNKIKEKLGIK